MISSPRHAAQFRSRTLGWIVAGAAAVGLVSAVIGSTVAFARLVVTPSRTRADDIRVLNVDLAARTVTISANADTRIPGTYSLWFSRSTGHARLGAIIAETATTVTRELLAVDFGEITAARTARIGGWVHLSPRDLRRPAHTVFLESDVGACPAWLLPATTVAGSSRWVIQIHGRGAKRSETLRAVPVFHDQGYTALLVSWRNDGDAPSSPDGRYGLGGTEWQDVEAAISFAVNHGARNIVLMGWSMGGAIALQALDHSAFGAYLRGVVLESPVVDWLPTLEQRGVELGLPRILSRIPLALLSGPAHRATGVAKPIDFPALNWVRRADELTVPILLLHSADDGYVPITASRLLAARRPNLVTFHEWSRAGHTRLWNFDPERFTREIVEWLTQLSRTAPYGDGYDAESPSSERSTDQRA